MNSHTHSSAKVRRHKDLGVEGMRKRDWTTALKHFGLAYQEKPGDPWLLHRMGDCFLKAGKVTKAAERFETLATKYEEMGQYRKALAIWKQVNDFYPSADILIAIERVEALQGVRLPVLKGSRIDEEVLIYYGVDIDFDE